MQPTIKVGIVSAEEINTVLLGEYLHGEDAYSGPQTFSVAPTGQVAWQGRLYDSIDLKAADEKASFDVTDVVIGVNFHWERKETQRFSGNLRIIVENGKITLINILPVEDYLLSVISSEMSAKASLELLKAHAVISRSWLLAQIEHRDHPACADTQEMIDTDEELVRWYDRDDHINFDVCADDHCQRYQGITRQSTPKVTQAIHETFGQVLKSPSGELCDARFSKCCGGVFEEFQNCWQPRPESYLVARRDSVNPLDFPDLRLEPEAQKWINSRPEAFCNTSDAHILAQVLNNYDQETTDFYRWTVEYDRETLAELVHRRTGVDYGYIMNLEAVERGTSGRIVRLRITGTKRTRIIGKELEIRRSLSESHLYSSAFTVERLDIDPKTGIPAKIRLHGAGWGHGVGLCQIGAAVMGEKGFPYDKILLHYYPGASLEKLY